MHESIKADQWSSPSSGIEDENDETVLVGHSPCYLAGVCICSAEGKKLKQCHNKFLKALKACFKTPEEKSLLSSGMVVVQFQCSLDTSDELLEQLGGEQTVYFHVGHMSWKPYSPALQLLRLVEPPTYMQGSEYIFLQDLEIISERNKL
eukprot:4419763-Amphidinium_carterae.1